MYSDDEHSGGKPERHRHLWLSILTYHHGRQDEHKGVVTRQRLRSVPVSFLADQDPVLVTDGHLHLRDTSDDPQPLFRRHLPDQVQTCNN